MNSRLKCLTACVALSASLLLWADTQTVGDLTWHYSIIGNSAEICTRFPECELPSIDPSFTGALTIPSSLGGKPVKSIGGRAFYGCSGITQITIPNSVTNIGSAAFVNCTSLTQVAIPSSVRSIENKTFSGCTSLERVTIPNSVTNIGEYAFECCFALEKVDIPASVTEIKNHVFYVCGLASVTIPNSVTTIGASAFDCSALESVTIPDSVTSIGDAAFRDCGSLEDVSISASVKDIGNEAFRYCSELNTVAIYGASVNFGNKVFSGCSNIKHIIATDAVFTHGLALLFASSKDAIERVDALDGTTYVSCSGLSALKDVFIPKSVTTLDGYSFAACPSLVSVSIAHDNPNFTSNGGCVLTKDGTKLVACYSGFSIPSSVIKIGDCAFRERKDVSYVNIPDSVTEIGDAVFAYCSSLKSVDLSNSLTNIGKSVFYICRELEEITIPGMVASIGVSAFEGCSALVSVELGNYVETIGDYAFMDCLSLEEIAMPPSVTYIGKWAFCECENLVNVKFLGNAPTTAASAFEDVKSGCTASVKKAAKGFPDENMYWNRLRIVHLAEPDLVQWNVGFDLNGAEAQNGFPARTVDDAAAIGTLPTPSRDGYTFAGWWTEAAGGTEVTATTTVAADMTLFAHWTENLPPPPAYTETTPVPVRYDWLAKYSGILSATGNDYEAAAMRPTGKKDGKGNALCVWHDYLAGTDPTNASSIFKAKVEFENGLPKVGWEPDLNENGVKSERFYKVFGKKSLAANENWTRIVDEADQKNYSFFKVTVNMEETPDTEEELKFGDGTGYETGGSGGNPGDTSGNDGSQTDDSGEGDSTSKVSWTIVDGEL